MTPKTWKPIETEEQYETYRKELYEIESTFKMTEKLVESSYSSEDPQDYDKVIEQCFKCSEAYTKWLNAKSLELGYAELLNACRAWKEKHVVNPYTNLVQSLFGAPQSDTAEATTPPAAG